MSEKHLNAKQEAFCLEYIKDFNITQAAIRVGYSEKTASQQGSRLFGNVNVQEYIEKLKDGVVKDKNRIIEENLKFWNKLRDDDKGDIRDRLRASEYLGKYAAMFTEKYEHKLDAVIENKADYSRLSVDEMWQLRSLMLKAEQNDKRPEGS